MAHLLSIPSILNHYIQEPGNDMKEGSAEPEKNNDFVKNTAIS